MVTKIRIIYTGEDEILKEYVKCFFEFIGVMVCEYKLEKSERVASDLKEIPYDGSVVNIALGSIVPYVQKYKGHSNLEFYYTRFDDKNDDAKTQAREKLLDELISKIWEKDSINLPVIQRIRKLFVSAEENRDLFYILYGEQIVGEINILFDELAKEAAIKPFFNDYIQNKFNELLFVFQVLSNENKEGKLSLSPYGEFAIINIQEHLKHILSLFESQIRAAERWGEKLKIDNSMITSLYDLRNMIISFIHKYPQFISAKYLAISLDCGTLDICAYLIQEGQRFREKKYYSKAALISALEKEQNSYSQDKVIEDYELACEYDPLGVDARLQLADYIIKNAKREETYSFFDDGNHTISSFEYYDREEVIKASRILLPIVSFFENNGTNDLLVRKRLIDIYGRVLFLKRYVNIRRISTGIVNCMVDTVLATRLSIFLQVFELEEVEKLIYNIINPFILNCAIKIKTPVLGYSSVNKDGIRILEQIINRIKSSYIRGPQEEEKQPLESEDNKTIK